MNEQFRTSASLLRRAQESLAGGVSSPFRAKFPVPLYFQDGCGCRLRDVDGNEYIDYTLAWGPVILGHRHPKVVEALSRQVLGPHTYGAQHELEPVVGELIQAAVPCAERIALTSSGSEAVQLALRLARASTGRNLIVKFEGHYHGWMDSVLLSYRPARDQAGPADSPDTVPGSRGQVSNAAENVIVLPWNDLESVERIFERRGTEIAGVILEPVLCNSGCLMPVPGYLEGLREVTRRHDALLIFDEIITGFRMALGGAQSFYGVTPDLATFGKAIGGGLPLSAVAGRKDIVELMLDGGVVFGGTFNGNPVSLAAARATLEELSRDGGAVLELANRIGKRLMDGIAAAAREAGIPVVLCGFGCAFGVHFTRRGELRDYRDILDDDAGLLARFVREALTEGVYLLPDGRFYVSTAHAETDADQTVEALRRVFARLA